MTDLGYQFMVSDLGQKVYKHLKGCKVSRFGCRRKYFMTGVNRIVQGFHSWLSNSLF